MRHLFLDNGELTRIDRLYRRVHQPTKQGSEPVLSSDNASWESHISIYGTTMYDPERKQFRRWYLTSPGKNEERYDVRGKTIPGNVTLLGYAESTDGTTWEKPDLGQVEINGDSHNSVIDIGRLNCEGASIIHDPLDPDPDKRYKAFYWEHGGEGTLSKEPGGRVLFGSGDGDGMWVSHSPDGIVWTDYDINPAIGLGSDSDQTVIWDPNLMKYCAYGRFGAGGRKTARSVSADFVSWSEPQLVFECDENDEIDTQFYALPLDLYEGLFIGVPWMYRQGVDGTIDTQLAVSRDGIRWERVGTRETFLPVGELGSWDDGLCRVGKQFITRDDDIMLFYGAVLGPHGGPKIKPTKNVAGGIGLALLRRDGWASLRAHDEQGSLLTRPLTVDGDTMHLNVDAGQGQATVTICDLDGRAIDGFGTSKPVAGDQLDAAVTWPEAALAKLNGERVRVMIRMRSADLFSFWFE